MRSFIQNMTMKKYLLVFLTVFNFILLNAQKHTPYSRSEIGFFGGGSYYIGDLNPYKQFKNSHVAGGLMYRYNIHSRVSLRFNLTYGSVSADDKTADVPVIINRNLNFRSDIIEFAGGFEFNYFPFQIGHSRYKGTFYFIAQAGFFHMDPIGKFNGVEMKLQPLGTEGQGTNLSPDSKYSLVQFCVPMGMGAKLTLWKFGTMNFEFGFRKTFTDYLDDVRNDVYVDAVKLGKENGEWAKQRSNQSLDKNPYGKRGTTSTKDWYVFYGVTLCFKMGSQPSCPVVQ